MKNAVPKKSFAPVFSVQCRVLILGSYPSPKSFDQNFYYGHPQNRFWPLLAALLQEEIPQTIPQKTRLLLDHKIALWDSLESCEIAGASDASIQNPVRNPVETLVAQGGIRHILCNGSAAFKYYEKLSKAKTGLPAHRMPSTSPANAAYSLDRLVTAWGPVLRSCLES